jgi:hypothetical protein
MASLVMGCPCTDPVMMIPSSTTSESASTSSTSSARFRTCQTSTKSLRKPTSMIMSAVVQSSLITPRFTVSQRSSWPTLRCALLSVRTTGRTTHALLAPWTCTSGMPFKHMHPYKDLHAYLERRFHAWYAKFKPASSEVVGVDGAAVGDIVSVGDVDGEAPPAKKNRFSLTLNGGSAAAATPPTPPEKEGSRTLQPGRAADRNGISSLALGDSVLRAREVGHRPNV